MGWGGVGWGGVGWVDDSNDAVANSDAFAPRLSRICQLNDYEPKSALRILHNSIARKSLRLADVTQVLGPM